jgi:hypothetical protein
LIFLDNYYLKPIFEKGSFKLKDITIKLYNQKSLTEHGEVINSPVPKFKIDRYDNNVQPPIVSVKDE